MINDTPYKRSFINILNDVITAMPTPVVTVFKVVAIDATNWTIYVDDFFYAAYNHRITIGGKMYKIISLDDSIGNFKMNISWDTGNSGAIIAPVTGQFTLYPFFFFHGTPVDTAQELGALKQASNKYPMIWLWDDFKERMSWDPSTANDRETSCKLFFLDQADPKIGPTDNRWETYINPMMKFRDNFMNYLQTQLQDFMIWGQETNDEYYSKFGVYISQKGVRESLLADNLAGVKMEGTFTIRSGPADFKNCGID